jgi:CheY-like chemotaxis protein
LDADVVGNGLEALEALRQNHYDVVLTDVQMPQMGGLAMMRRLCQEWLPEQRPCIIAVTSDEMPQVRACQNRSPSARNPTTSDLGSQSLSLESVTIGPTNARDNLKALGIAVTYQEFDMAHQIMPEVLVLVRRFVLDVIG